MNIFGGYRVKVKFNVKRYFQVLGISLAVIIAVAAVCMGIDFSGSMRKQWTTLRLLRRQMER